MTNEITAKEIAQAARQYEVIEAICKEHTLDMAELYDLVCNLRKAKVVNQKLLDYTEDFIKRWEESLEDDLSDLTEEWSAFCADNGLEPRSADEVFYELLDRRWKLG